MRSKIFISLICLFLLNYITACSAPKQSENTKLWAQMPLTVKKTHQKLLNAAYMKDFSAMEKLIDKKHFKYSFSGDDGNPIGYWKKYSSKDFFPVLWKVLRTKPRAEGDYYYWPGFFGVPFDELSEEQISEWIKISGKEEYETTTKMNEEDKKRWLKESHNPDEKFEGTGYVGMRLYIDKNGEWVGYIGGD